MKIEKTIQFQSQTLGYTFLDEIVFSYIHYSELYQKHNSRAIESFKQLEKNQQKVIIDYELLLFSIRINRLITALEKGKLKIIHERGKGFSYIDDRNFKDKAMFSNLPFEVFIKN